MFDNCPVRLKMVPIASLTGIQFLSLRVASPNDSFDPWALPRGEGSKVVDKFHLLLDVISSRTLTFDCNFKHKCIFSEWEVDPDFATSWDSWHPDVLVFYRLRLFLNSRYVSACACSSSGLRRTSCVLLTHCLWQNSSFCHVQLNEEKPRNPNFTLWCGRWCSV